MSEENCSIILTPEQIAIIENRENIPTPNTQQFTVECVRQTTNQYIQSIHQGLMTNPKCLHDGYEYKKKESCPIGKGNLDVSVNLKYRIKKTAKMKNQ